MPFGVVMKDYIFIGWHCDTHLALLIKQKLDILGYCGIVGGDNEHNPTEMRLQGRTINETVCYQIDRCSQAIFVFRKMDDLYTVGNNLFYELGYATSMFNSVELASRLHVFKINITKQEESSFFPSDLHGIWMKPLFSVDSSEEQLADDIIAEFLRCQIKLPSEEKMHIFNNSYLIDYELDMHFSRPQISDYEFAKRLLIYVQAAFVYHRVREAQQKCKDFRNDLVGHREPSVELLSAVDYVVQTLELFIAATPLESENGRILIEGRTFRNILKGYRRVASIEMQGCDSSDDSFAVETLVLNTSCIEQDEYKGMLIAQIQQHISYLYLVYLDNPGLSIEEKKSCAKNAICVSKTALTNFKLLKACISSDNYYDLYIAFTYRNLRLFSTIINDKECVAKYEKLSFNVRKKMHDDMQRSQRINPLLKRYVNLEYYLQICDTIDSFSPEDREDYLVDLNDFIEEVKRENANRDLMFSRLVEMYKVITSQK